MIIGTILRNIKTYSGINYVPLTYGNTFNGVVGNNGIGKSSILEALDSFFNSRPWNFNIVTRKSGLITTKPHIVPVFLIKKKEVNLENLEIAEKLSNYIWQLEESDILSQNRDQFKTFLNQLSILKRDYTSENSLLLPIGISHDNNVSLGFFNTKKLGDIFFEDFEKTQQVVNDEQIKIFEPLLLELRNLVEYIYIPKDIDPDSFTQLETKEIQSLMGETLTEIVEKYVPQNTIKEINDNLSFFLDNLTKILVDYSFRTVGQRQVKLKKNNVYKLIIEEYFKIRKLHKIEGAHYLEMSFLSSGEKQKAIIELAYHFLRSYRSNTKNIILAIDEPESSLHMSACYDQFNKLFELSILCKQLIFTTHWYGFIPTVETGSVCVVSKNDKEHCFDLVNINSYREEIKQVTKISKGKLPYDIRLKSINDFTQSIVTSILTNEPYNWLICEGSSEKIYFEKYFEDIKKEKKLRIIPVGGATEIKRIYNNLQVAYEDFKKEIKGKVILISDTDSQLVQYPIKDDLKNLLCYRIVNEDKKRKTILVKVNSNPISPKTEIEDTLNGKLFYETLLEFTENNTALNTIIEDIQNPSEEVSYYALDLAPSKQKVLEEFFDSDNNKFDFANKYVSKMTSDYIVPEWITEIKDLY